MGKSKKTKIGELQIINASNDAFSVASIIVDKDGSIYIALSHGEYLKTVGRVTQPKFSYHCDGRVHQTTAVNLKGLNQSPEQIKDLFNTSFAGINMSMSKDSKVYMHVSQRPALNAIDDIVYTNMTLQFPTINAPDFEEGILKKADDIKDPINVSHYSDLRVDFYLVPIAKRAQMDKIAEESNITTRIYKHPTLDLLIYAGAYVPSQLH